VVQYLRQHSRVRGTTKGVGEWTSTTAAGKSITSGSTTSGAGGARSGAHHRRAPRGRLTRRDFLRRGTAVGLSMPLLGGILEASRIPGARTSSSRPVLTGKAGSTIRAGILVPAGAINPITIADEGSLELLGNVGEFSSWRTRHSVTNRGSRRVGIRNAKADVWTFKIRQGVRSTMAPP